MIAKCIVGSLQQYFPVYADSCAGNVAESMLIVTISI